MALWPYFFFISVILKLYHLYARDVALMNERKGQVLDCMNIFGIRLLIHWTQDPFQFRMHN
jgi:hypothetical protein